MQRFALSHGGLRHAAHVRLQQGLSRAHQGPIRCATFGEEPSRLHATNPYPAPLLVPECPPRLPFRGPYRYGRAVLQQLAPLAYLAVGGQRCTSTISPRSWPSRRDGPASARARIRARLWDDRCCVSSFYPWLIWLTNGMDATGGSPGRLSARLAAHRPNAPRQDGYFLAARILTRTSDSKSISCQPPSARFSIAMIPPRSARTSRNFERFTFTRYGCPSSSPTR